MNNRVRIYIDWHDYTLVENIEILNVIVIIISIIIKTIIIIL